MTKRISQIIAAAGLSVLLVASGAPAAWADENDPRTAAEAKAYVDKLEVEATQAESRGITAAENAKKARASMAEKNAEIEQTTAAASQLKAYMGKFALNAYKTRGADSPEVLVITGDIDGFTTRAATTQRIIRNADEALREYQTEISKLNELRRSAAQDLRDAESAEADARDAEQQWKDKIARATQVYEGLSAQEKAAYDRQAEADRAARARQTAAPAPAAPAPAAKAPAPASADAPSSGRGGSVVGFAMGQVGKAYGMGGTGTSYYDCSGLAYASYASVGVGIPRTSYAQLAGGTPVSLANAQPGDLVIYNGGSHTAIYIGGGQVVQALNPGTGVVVTDVGLAGWIDGVRRYG